MLVRTLLVLAAGLVTAQLLSALPVDTDNLETDTLLKQVSETHIVSLLMLVNLVGALEACFNTH